MPSTSDSDNSQSDPLSCHPDLQQHMAHSRANKLAQLPTGEIDQQSNTGGIL